MFIRALLAKSGNSPNVPFGIFIQWIHIMDTQICNDEKELTTAVLNNMDESNTYNVDNKSQIQINKFCMVPLI